MTSTRKLTIPGDEWEHVRRAVVPHTSSDRGHPALCHVELAVVEGRRRWCATDSYSAVRFDGGETKSSYMTVLLHKELFSPARPKPKTVRLKVTSSEVAASSDGWDRFAERDDSDYPDVAALIDRYADDGRPLVNGAAFDLDAIPKKGTNIRGVLPLVFDYTPQVRAKNGDGAFHRVGSCTYGSPTLLAVNAKFLRRMVQTIPDHEATVKAPLSPVAFHGEGMTGLLMPMRENVDAWFGENWHGEKQVAS